jgi:hypothetical protein
MDSKTLNRRRTRRTNLTLENDNLRKGIKNDDTKAAQKFVVRGFKTKLKSGLTLRHLDGMLDENEE